MRCETYMHGTQPCYVGLYRIYNSRRTLYRFVGYTISILGMLIFGVASQSCGLPINQALVVAT